MTRTDPYLLVRAASLYVTAMLTFGVWIWRRPTSRAVSGALLAFFWNLPVILVLNEAAAYVGWWQFEARGGLLLGVPVDLYLSWAWLWGGVAALAFPGLGLAAVVLIALAFDLALMPLAAPVLQLGPWWLAGEAVGLAAALIPAQRLARWTTHDDRLVARAALQVLAFAGLTLIVVPVVTIEASASAWLNPLHRPAWHVMLLAQMLAMPALVGLTAVQEFVTRGNGTPVPFDPPRRLVTSGIYAYVRNPMQLSGVVLLLLLGVVLQNYWIASAGVLAHLYSAGLAGWDENEDLRRRFGDDWLTYRSGVRPWFPRFRPWRDPDRPSAQLFVAEGCDMCREVGLWLSRRGARGLVILPAEVHPSGALTRITYEPQDGSRAASGVEAVARALEHVHFGWALVGCVLRLPGLLQIVQLLVDASGGEPQSIAPRSTLASARDQQSACAGRAHSALSATMGSTRAARAAGK